MFQLLDDLEDRGFIVVDYPKDYLSEEDGPEKSAAGYCARFLYYRCWEDNVDEISLPIVQDLDAYFIFSSKANRFWHCDNVFEEAERLLGNGEFVITYSKLCRIIDRAVLMRAKGGYSHFSLSYPDNSLADLLENIKDDDTQIRLPFRFNWCVDNPYNWLCYYFYKQMNLADIISDNYHLKSGNLALCVSGTDVFDSCVPFLDQQLFINNKHSAFFSENSQEDLIIHIRNYIKTEAKAFLDMPCQGLEYCVMAEASITKSRLTSEQLGSDVEFIFADGDPGHEAIADFEEFNQDFFHLGCFKGKIIESISLKLALSDDILKESHRLCSELSEFSQANYYVYPRRVIYGNWDHCRVSAFCETINEFGQDDIFYYMPKR